MAYIEHDFPIEGLNKIAQKEGNAKKPIYQMHKWWARRLGSVFRMLILATFAEDDIHPTELWRRFYTRNQLTVERDGKRVPPIILDPFMGGGTTIVEALRLGCKVIGVDLNPVAWFVTKKEIEAVDLDALDAAFKHLEKTVAPKILRYYKTTCPLGHPADVMYVFWVKKVTCVGCGQDVRLFPSFRLATKGKEHTVFCPQCYHIFQVDTLSDEARCEECGHTFVPGEGYTSRGYYTCPACGQRERVLDAVRRKEGPPEAEMFAIEYFAPPASERVTTDGATNRPTTMTWPCSPRPRRSSCGEKTSCSSPGRRYPPRAAATRARSTMATSTGTRCSTSGNCCVWQCCWRRFCALRIGTWRKR